MGSSSSSWRISQVTLPMHQPLPWETRTPSVGPRDQGSATSTATLTVATSSPLPVHRGASLPWPVTSSRAQNGSKRAWKNNVRFFQFGNQLALSNIMILDIKPGIIFVDLVCELNSLCVPLGRVKNMDLITS